MRSGATSVSCKLCVDQSAFGGLADYQSVSVGRRERGSLDDRSQRLRAGGLCASASLAALGGGFGYWELTFGGEARVGGACGCVLCGCGCLVWLGREVRV